MPAFGATWESCRSCLSVVMARFQNWMELGSTRDCVDEGRDRRAGYVTTFNRKRERAWKGEHWWKYLLIGCWLTSWLFFVGNSLLVEGRRAMFDDVGAGAEEERMIRVLRPTSVERVFIHSVNTVVTKTIMTTKGDILARISTQRHKMISIPRCKQWQRKEKRDDQRKPGSSSHILPFTEEMCSNQLFKV